MVYFDLKKNPSEFLVEQRAKRNEQRAKGNKQRATSKKFHPGKNELEWYGKVMATKKQYKLG